MFRDLRPQSTFFIFNKGEEPGLKIGTVTNISQPVMKPPTNFNAFPPQPEYTIDVMVKVGESTLTFNKLPTHLDMTEYPEQRVVVSTNRDRIKSEIENTLTHSRQILSSTGRHEKIVQECEKILQEFNPTFKKEKEHEEEIKQLKEQVSKLESKLGGLDRIEALLLDQNKSSNKNSKNN